MLNFLYRTQNKKASNEKLHICTHSEVYRERTKENIRLNNRLYIHNTSKATCFANQLFDFVAI